MADRLVELLLKAVRHLPQDEQDEVLAVLLGGVLPGGGPGPGQQLTSAGSSQVTMPGIDPWHIDIPAIPAPHVGVRAQSLDVVAAPPLGTLDALHPQGLSEPAGELKVLPVRLPVADYERLRAFSREHGFSMAVIIRTLVERFLDERASPPDDAATG